MFERRHFSRAQVELFFNKYLDGFPYLCRSLDLSERGVLAQTYCEPAHWAEAFSLELQLPGLSRSLWVWARRVWQDEQRQALKFVGLEGEDKRRLRQFLSAA